MAHFAAISHIEVWPFLASLFSNRHKFDDDSSRAVGSYHGDTRSIILRVPSKCYTPGMTADEMREAWYEDVPHRASPWGEDWIEALDLLDVVKGRFPEKCGGVGKAMVVELKPQGVVGWHTDEGAYARAHYRVHVPLVTNPGALMHIGTEAAHLPVGAMTVLDVGTVHSAVNFGQTPRIHLIVDLRRQDAVPPTFDVEKGF